MPTYVELIAARLTGKMVEVYLGDQHEQVQFSDNAKNVNSVMCGKIVEGEGDLLVLESFYQDRQDKKIKAGNLIFINSCNIRAVCEINGSGTMRDAIVSANDSPKFEK